MYTEIITPSQPTIILTLPEEMVGKKISIKAEEIEDVIAEGIESRRAKLQSIFADCSVNLSNFKFDRNEANNYE